jgi:hypothetical protein
MTYKQAEAMELISNGGEDYDVDSRNYNTESSIKQDMPKPKSSWMRQSVRQLHGLNVSTPFFRDIHREEGGECTLTSAMSFGQLVMMVDLPWWLQRMQPISVQVSLFR